MHVTGHSGLSLLHISSGFPGINHSTGTGGGGLLVINRIIQLRKSETGRSAVSAEKGCVLPAVVSASIFVCVRVFFEKVICRRHPLKRSVSVSQTRLN